MNWLVEFLTGHKHKPDERAERVEADTRRTDASTRRTDHALRTLDDNELLTLRLRLIDRRKQERGKQ